MPTTGENFGHSIVESMLLGRPIIISDQTPWTDVNGQGGFAFPIDQKEKFINALAFLCDREQNEFDLLIKQIKTYIEEKLNVKEIIQEYIRMFGG